MCPCITIGFLLLSRVLATLATEILLLPSVPSGPQVNEEGWRHWTTKLTVAATNGPHHMVHDVIAAEGEIQTIVGKFDYGSVFHKDLEDEFVKVFIVETGLTDWVFLGEYLTDSDGKIFVEQNLSVGEYIVKMVVPGDLSYTYGFVTVVEPGRKAVVFDLDGTITARDTESMEDYLGLDETIAIYYYADEMVRLYHSLGYQIIYLTARPYWTVDRTRAFMRDIGIPEGILHGTSSNSDSIPGLPTEKFKTDYLLHLIHNVHVDIVRAYGNAITDIDAFDNAGVPKSQTFIVGENAGKKGTQALSPDYFDHYEAVATAMAGGGNT